ncbi:MAG TPA: hypothetical protein VGT99_02745 [Gammaproteobacteria bacterium]|nr:hypothetical protein [Gammaproteobacteria bacterium]
MSWKFLRILALAALLGGLAASPPASASNYVKIQSGTIQSTDFLKHTITVNGQTYAVTSATVYSGNMSFSLLSAGMKIQYFLAGPATGGSQTIVRIIVLPS